MRIQPTSQKVLLIAVAMCCGLVDAAIEEFSFADTRGLSMGGANAASVNDAAAGLINPAALGFMARPVDGDLDNNGLGDQTVGWNIVDFGLGASLTGDLGDYLEIMGKVDFNNFGTGKLKEPGNVKSLISLAGVLGNVGDNDTIVASASVGTALQIGHFGVGVRSFGQMGGWINDLDLVRLGLGFAVSDLIDDLRDAIGSDTVAPGAVLSDSQKQDLRDAFNTPDIEDVIDYIDAKVSELIENGTIGGDQVKGAVDTLSKIIENAGGVDELLSDNRTSITGRAFAAVEVPVSYGYAVNDNLSFGLTAKAMFGRVYGTQVWVFNESNTEFLEDSLDSSHDSATLGLDAAMLYRIPKFQFALVGHNLNRPRFEGYDQTIMLETFNGPPVEETVRVPDVVLDPQVIIGAAYFPTKRLTLESDFELLETGTLLNGYDIQRLSFGSEWDLSLMALRLGTYRNLAEGDFGWVLTGGVGFNLWALSVDLGGAVSINDTVEYDGTDYPRTAQLYAAISLDF
jgi:hypothetical protein